MERYCATNFPISHKCASLFRRINLHVFESCNLVDTKWAYKVRDETNHEKCRADREPQTASAVFPAVSALSYFSSCFFFSSSSSSFSSFSLFPFLPLLSFSLPFYGGFQTCIRRRIYRSLHVRVSNDELSCQLWKWAISSVKTITSELHGIFNQNNLFLWFSLNIFGIFYRLQINNRDLKEYQVCLF